MHDLLALLGYLLVVLLELAQQLYEVARVCQMSHHLLLPLVYLAVSVHNLLVLLVHVVVVDRLLRLLQHLLLQKQLVVGALALLYQLEENEQVVAHRSGAEDLLHFSF